MDAHLPDSGASIGAVRTRVFKVPTDAAESDATLAWDSTTMVLAEIDAGGRTGLGYTYADSSTACLLRDTLAGLLQGRDAFDIPACRGAMLGAIRNYGRPGVCSMAIAAADIALWDLKAKLLDQPLVRLLGAVRARVPVYGSGGFTSYSPAQLEAQLGGWVTQGCTRVKIKIGRHPEQDAGRVRIARRAIGAGVELFVDANGGYRRKQALGMMPLLQEQGVTWFEEPVSSDDLEGLRLLRDRAPGDIQISAGEYGYDTPYFRRMLQAGAVDVLQADATRCAGISGLLQAAALCDGFLLPLSTHTAPAVHLHAACALAPVRHIEWFHDHARIEQMLFDGAPQIVDGEAAPDLTRPGLGLTLKTAEAERYAS